jgi:hypothetical protein
MGVDIGIRISVGEVRFDEDGGVVNKCNTVKLASCTCSVSS